MRMGQWRGVPRMGAVSPMHVWVGVADTDNAGGPDCNTRPFG
jgi:hypothetical protein